MLIAYRWRQLRSCYQFINAPGQDLKILTLKASLTLGCKEELKEELDNNSAQNINFSIVLGTAEGGKLP